MKITAKTDIGNGRAENQDNYRAIQFPGDMVWAVVCDGMGGAKSGQTASRIAVDLLRKKAVENLNKLSLGDEKQYLIDSTQEINRKVYALSMKESALTGMGTTVVQMLIYKDIAHIVHMGDSRAYLFHNNILSQITRDHSYVQEMVENGKLTFEEAERHPKKNLITRALGVNPNGMPEYTSCYVEQGDILMVCTDGLSNTLPTHMIEKILGSKHFYDTSDCLINQALQEGAQDNVTVLLVGIEHSEA